MKEFFAGLGHSLPQSVKLKDSLLQSALWIWAPDCSSTSSEDLIAHQSQTSQHTPKTTQYHMNTDTIGMHAQGMVTTVTDALKPPITKPAAV